MKETISAYQVFGGFNCAEGFVSSYSAYFASARKTYVIKGGPGTGKSKLMKEFAARALRAGEKPLLILCASDPTSLDGVLLPGLGIGILDGTAPHTVDPILPGVDGEIVDLGRFWDRGSLEKNGETLRRLNSEKKEAYDAVYRDFRMIALLLEERQKLLSSVTDSEKMTAAVKRLLPPAGKEKRADVRLMQLRSIGMKGNVLLPLPACRERIDVTGPFGSGRLFLRAALNEASARGLTVYVSWHPILRSVPEILWFPETGLLLSAFPSDRTERVIRMSRFLPREDLARIRLSLRQNEKLTDCFLASARRLFEEIGQSHAEIEKIYGEAMDFTLKEKYEEEFLASVFG